MQKLKWVLFSILILGIIYFLGPHPSRAVYNMTLPEVPTKDLLENYLLQSESAHRLRPNNEARIVWANDSIKSVTDYAIVYLHGFSASHEEGNPVHRNLAAAFGCNLFLSRLAEHGIDTTEQLMMLTSEIYWESAKHALAVGKRIGKKIILMGTSTGASQALQLAATFPEDIAGLVLYSPNIAINDPNAWLLNDPWGLQIARIVKGGNYHHPEDSRPEYRQYWNTPYRLEALVSLEEMLETSMTEATFRKINQPVLMLYYYKDEAHQDNVVKVSAMKEMFHQLGTPGSLKREKALPKTGNHVIASPIKSGDIFSVERETAVFFSELLKLQHLHPKEY